MRPGVALTVCTCGSFHVMSDMLSSPHVLPHVDFHQVNQYPFLRVSRTESWGWMMENAWVLLTQDSKSGPNPGQ